MKLSHVVAQHGYQPSELGEIEKARLYERRNADGALELLCVQKICNVFRIDRQALAEIPGLGVLPLGEGVANQIIPRDQLQGYLEVTLAPAMAA